MTWYLDTKLVLLVWAEDPTLTPEELAEAAFMSEFGQIHWHLGFLEGIGFDPENPTYRQLLWALTDAQSIPNVTEEEALCRLKLLAQETYGKYLYW